MRAGVGALLVLLAAASAAEAQTLRGVRKAFAEIGEKVIPATVIVRGSGAPRGYPGSSGVIVHEDGYVLSDADSTLVGYEMGEDGKPKPGEDGQGIKIHGVNATVRMPAPDHRVFAAVLVHRDPETDTSLLRITDKVKGKLETVPMGSSDNLAVGAFSVVAGNTFSSGVETEPALSMGIVSALVPRAGGVGGRWETIYTSATVVAGSNGGPMVDKEGRLVGIISTILGLRFHRNSPYLGFGQVTPIDRIRTRYRHVEDFGKIFPDPESLRPQSREAGILEEVFALIARKAWPSIVSVEVKRAEGTVTTFKQNLPGLPEDADRYTGPFTGVVISRDGRILTSSFNLWAFDKIESVTVHLPGGKSVPAKVLGRDLRKRLALLKVEANGLVPLPRAAPDEVEVGRIVLALGNPWGKDRAGSPLLTFGLLGGTNRLPDTLAAIHTDAGLNDAMAGGALMTLDGKLLGVTVLENPEYYGRVSGVGFAIPLPAVDASVKELAQGKTLSRGWLGIGWGKPAGDRLTIGMVVEDGPAAKAGVRAGDVIVKVDGTDYSVKDFAALSAYFHGSSPGQALKLEVERGGKAMEFRVILGTPPD